MNTESVFFLTVGFMTLMLALQATFLWRRRFNDKPIGYWVLAIWLYALTDFLFVASNWVNFPQLRLLSRILVMATYGALFLGAQSTAGIKPSVRQVLLVLTCYGLSLPLLFSDPESTPARVVLTRIGWSVFCFLSYLNLRKGNQHFSGSIMSPATIFLLQATYLALRAVVYGALVLLDLPRDLQILTYIDYANVAMFDIALFVGLLVALIDQQNHELAASRVEIQTLSGLLPVCSWCKKLRDDEGYWHEVTDYISRTNPDKVTHGMCRPCAEKLVDDLPA